MTDLAKRIANLSPEQRVLLERRLQPPKPSGRPAAEPIAVVGMGCRLPGGASSPEAFWRLLESGFDAITEVPAERWPARELYDADPERPGKAATRWGGFLEGIDLFDASFFGISPREARQMDPQQRLLLEVAWEALESAGLRADRLAGSAVGVYVGVHSLSQDYFLRQAATLERVDSYTSTGAAHSIVANRLSYLLDLRGPSLAVDTACSSSLVAVHLACQSLRLFESDFALAAGVNLVLSPEVTVAFSRLAMMAADGHCKTFDARADGFVRGEGCGVVALRRLADARRDGDPVLAIVRGSAVNQDGATNGITAPSGLAQQAVVRQALENAGVASSAVSFVETHGTGTALGDPIEVEALAEALGPAGGPCLLGALKTNIGHLEGASGIAGLIKAVLCLRHRRVPANLHFQQPNPHLGLDRTRFVVPTRSEAWTSPEGRPRVAGVSSFGFGGTNAHVVLEEAPGEAVPPPDEARGPFLLPLSARSESALPRLVDAYAAFLSDPEQGGGQRLADLAYTAAVRRSHHRHRAAVVGETHAEWTTALARVATLPAARTAHGRQGVVFAFSGEPPLGPAAGRELFSREPVFRGEIERCDAELKRQAGWSLVSGSGGPEPSISVERPRSALFALQVALVELWKSWGIEPAALVGQGSGEAAAAYVAGALAFEEALEVAVARDRETTASAPGGQSGAAEGIGRGQTEGVEAMLARVQIEQTLRNLRPKRPTLALVSTVTGRPAAEGDYAASYWGRSLRERSRFVEAVTALAREGHLVYLEIGAGRALAPVIERCGPNVGRDLVAVTSTTGGPREQASLLEAVAELDRRGLPVALQAVAPRAGRHVSLPTYPWQRSRYWLNESA